ncbi:MAG: ATP-binding protein, partial [Rhizobiales bacterium]|nr:ATP-binding protein [Rhizobacter sp.]
MATNRLLPDRDTLRSAPAAVTASSQRLAESLRRARMTVLCGEPGAGKSALVAEGLLPLLRRRSADAVVSVTRRVPDVVLPFPDRRSRGRASLAEMVIFLDAWNAPPLTSLHDGIDASLRAAGVDPEWHREKLTERLQSLASRFGTRFLLVLDGFEALLQAPDKADAREALTDELAHLLNLPVPANLLITLRADAQELLAPLRRRLYGVSVEVLALEEGRILQVSRAGPAPTPAPSPEPAVSPTSASVSLASAMTRSRAPSPSP